MNISISRDGVEIGEWTEEEVRAFYAEGRLVATDNYWKEGMGAWESLAGFVKPPPPFPAPKTKAGPVTETPPRIPSPAQSQMVVAPPPRTANTSKPKGIGRLLYVGLILLQWVIIAIVGVCTACALGPQNAEKAILEYADTINGVAMISFLVLSGLRFRNIGISTTRSVFYPLALFMPLLNLILLGVLLFARPDSAPDKYREKKGYLQQS